MLQYVGFVSKFLICCDMPDPMIEEGASALRALLVTASEFYIKHFKNCMFCGYSLVILIVAED